MSRYGSAEYPLLAVFNTGSSHRSASSLPAATPDLCTLPNWCGLPRPWSAIKELVRPVKSFCPLFGLANHGNWFARGTVGSCLRNRMSKSLELDVASHSDLTYARFDATMYSSKDVALMLVTWSHDPPHQAEASLVSRVSPAHYSFFLHE